mmetsp:Transcript_20478/g.34928  ORF Transcript_20478/g.34928 Transcript_20478/m.34928 type:complete len:201 (-) Transcript_20478:744-1346(-)
MVVPTVETWNRIRTHIRVITLALLALCTSTLLLLAITITITGTDTTFSRSLSRGGGLLGGGGGRLVVVIRSSTKGICKGIIPHPPLSSCTSNIDQMMIILSIIIPRIHHHHTHPSTTRRTSRRRSRSRRNQIPMHIQLRSHRRPINRLLMSIISSIIPIHTLRNRRLIKHIIIMTFKAETHLSPLVKVESEGVVLVEYIP